MKTAMTLFFLLIGGVFMPGISFAETASNHTSAQVADEHQSDQTPGDVAAGHGKSHGDGGGAKQSDSKQAKVTEKENASEEISKSGSVKKSASVQHAVQESAKKSSGNHGQAGVKEGGKLKIKQSETGEAPQAKVNDPSSTGAKGEGNVSRTENSQQINHAASQEASHFLPSIAYGGKGVSAASIGQITPTGLKKPNGSTASINGTGMKKSNRSANQIP